MSNSRRSVIWGAAAVLLLMFGLATTSMAADTPTFDEQGFLVRGLAYLRGEENGGSRRIRVGHPLGLNALNAALLVADPSVKLPSDDPSWQETGFHRPAELFLWEIGNDVGHIIFLARVPTVWLGLLLAAIGGRWAAEMAGGRRGRTKGNGRHASIAGLITLLLLALDPNILAHTRLVTTDLGLAFAATLAGYTLWRFVRRPSWREATLAGMGLGLLLNTKFTALLFLPLFAVVMCLGFVRLWHDRSAGDRRLLGRYMVMGLGFYPLVAFLTLWAGYGFQVGGLSAPLPIVGQLGGRAIPLSDYFDQLIDIGNRLEVSTPSFLLGRYSDTGWWYYFPITFLLKTPLPVLLLLIWAVIRSIRLFRQRATSTNPNWFDLAVLLIPPAGYFAIALTTEINLGYRHLLPILPFIYVFVGVVLGQVFSEAAIKPGKAAPRIAIVLLGWFVIVTLWIYPHFLAYFNVLIGGPNNGWRALVDSNLDWGQDLGRLGAWLNKNDIERVWLSYFGEGRPEYYGITYDGLDSFPPRLMNPAARPFYPYDPAPGWYAISATTLQGVHFLDHDQFRYFRDRDPAAKIGYSIFLYEQPRHGDPVDLLLGGTQVDQLTLEDFEQLGTNDVRLHWFDAGRAVVVPDGTRPIWLAFGNQDLHPLLAPFLEFDRAKPVASGDGYRLYRSTPHLPVPTEEEIALVLDEGQINFGGASLLEMDDGNLTAVTTWRQEGMPQSVKIFIHVLDATGEIVAQWDGIDAAWEGWRTGDKLIQVHELPVKGLPSGSYRVVAGLYDPENLRRWLSSSGADVIELGTVAIP